MSLCGALSLFAPETCHAKLAHPGYSGLISTPNAEVLPQGHLAIGFSWVDGPETFLFAPRTNRLYVFTIGILPGLEATLRQTQVIGWHDPEAPGVQHAFDRMFSAKYAIPMPGGFPHVAIGVQDIASGNILAGTPGVKPGSTQYGQSTAYGVLGGSHGRWSWHSGIGISQAFINGPFAGIVYQPLESLSLHGEWDSRSLNWGARAMLPFGLWLHFSVIKQTTLALGTGLELAL